MFTKNDQIDKKEHRKRTSLLLINKDELFMLEI